MAVQLAGASFRHLTTVELGLEMSFRQVFRCSLKICCDLDFGIKNCSKGYDRCK
jgi:hypothetical protein